MASLEDALASLRLSETVNYAETIREYNYVETTLRRRHQGKQRSCKDADFIYNTCKIHVFRLFISYYYPPPE